MHCLAHFFSLWRELQNAWDPHNFGLSSQFLCCAKREKWSLSPLFLSPVSLSCLFLLFQTSRKSQTTMFRKECKNVFFLFYGVKIWTISQFVYHHPCASIDHLTTKPTINFAYLIYSTCISCVS